jgi:hypothetical protein
MTGGGKKLNGSGGQTNKQTNKQTKEMILL